MTYRNDPRWQDAQSRLVTRMADDETPDDAFARAAVAAYEMYLIETGREVPPHLSYAESLGAYGLLAERPAA